MKQPRPCKAKGVLSKTLRGETVILKKDSWQCYLLNPAASYTWRLCNGENSVKNLVDSLSGKYGIKKSLARKDIGKLLSCLKKRGLIDRVN